MKINKHGWLDEIASVELEYRYTGQESTYAGNVHYIPSGGVVFELGDTTHFVAWTLGYDAASVRLMTSTVMRDKIPSKEWTTPLEKGQDIQAVRSLLDEVARNIGPYDQATVGRISVLLHGDPMLTRCLEIMAA